jgi:tetratricopeptide (TPR) repeat protein
MSNFDGAIDEVAIYNRALGGEEIAHHYNNGLAGKGYYEAYSPKDLKQDAITELEDAKTGDKKIDKKIDKAIDHIQKSLNINPKHPDKPWKKHSLWVDDNHLDPKHGKKVFDEERKAVKYLQKLIKDKKVSDSVKDVCREVIDTLVAADKLLAETALEEAKTYEGTDKKVDKEIGKAEKELGKVEKDLEKGKPDKAINHYKKAWQHAQKAI